MKWNRQAFMAGFGDAGAAVVFFIAMAVAVALLAAWVFVWTIYVIPVTIVSALIVSPFAWGAFKALTTDLDT